MFLHVALMMVIVCSSQGMPRPESPQQSPRTTEPKQVLYVPERQQYSPELQYNLALLEPQFQIPSYNFIGDKQHFPRVQPQIVLYHGGPAPGQPFLLQPGSPPGNFLLPQGPNVIIRDPSPAPPRPVFVAGYPKPAHIPPIEKDAEEVPTNPSKIPPLAPKGENKPEKLETFNEDENPRKVATEADVLAAADRNPAFNPKTHLRPGQRFFILNGQPLFSNFPYNNHLYPGINPNINVKYAQTGSNFIPQNPTKTISSYPNVLLRNAQIQDTPSNQELVAHFQQGYPANLVLLNQPGSFDDSLLKSPVAANLEEAKEEKPEFRQRTSFDNGHSYEFLQLRDNGAQDDDSVVIESEDQQNNEESETAEMEDEVVAADKPVEPTISQAQPGAIALAGPGGVAAAAPRGTAFVGKEGIAISSPQATAVAGPKRDQIVDEKNKPQGKKKP